MTAPVDTASQPGLSAAAADSPRTLAEAWPVFIRHGSPRIVLAALAMAVAARVALGDWSAWDLLPLAALAAYWPLQEWLIHVFILHYRPRRVLGRELDFHVPRKHREHHRRPWEIDILFIPTHSLVTGLPVLALLWFAAAPTAALALTGLVVHLTLTAHYEWVHFLLHTRYQPRTTWYRRLWRNHRLHHFKNEHYWFGVTMLGGDRLLGTAPAMQAVPTSAACRAHAGGPGR